MNVIRITTLIYMILYMIISISIDMESIEFYKITSLMGFIGINIIYWFGYHPDN